MNDVSDDVEHMWTIVVSIWLSSSVCLVGVVTNYWNIRVFKRQGLTDNVNISLMGLAIADLTCVVISLWMSVCELLNILDPPTLTFQPASLLMMTASILRIIATRVSSWLTALTPLQRCLAVTLPFQVRQMFTPRNTSISTLSVSILVLAGYMCVYYLKDLVTVIDSRHNITRVVMIPAARDRANQILNNLLFISLPLVNILVISLATILMISSIMRASRWRHTITHGETTPADDHHDTSGTKRLSNRKPQPGPHTVEGTDPSKDKKEVRTSKMVIAVMLIFIVCNLPSNFLFAMRNVFPEFSDAGSLKKYFLHVAWSGLLAGEHKLECQFLRLLFHEFKVQGHVFTPEVV
ncbi:uncharacterized protein LOC131929038 [Physella acuta]|uniref:uncharacterized protein LOC131929038 n=1 Tax=Physella acuta TaxID=109671 RepID=UPI0027DD234F|nr:uncharacterized protein LOC131929038 [Physella acuta]